MYVYILFHIKVANIVIQKIYIQNGIVVVVSVHFVIDSYGNRKRCQLVNYFHIFDEF